MTSDLLSYSFHPRGKGESVRRGDPVTGNPRPPQYLAQHSKKTALTLAQDAQEAVQAARKLLSKEGVCVCVCVCVCISICLVVCVFCILCVNSLCTVQHDGPQGSLSFLQIFPLGGRSPGLKMVKSTM